MDSNAHFKNIPKIELTYQIKNPQFAGLQPLQSRKRKSEVTPDVLFPASSQPCICQEFRDALVGKLIAPSLPISNEAREQMMDEFADAKRACLYCAPQMEGPDVCICFEPRKRTWNMKRPQPEPVFPNLFEILCAEIEEEYAEANCPLCTADFGYYYDLTRRYPNAPKVSRWVRDSKCVPRLVMVAEEYAEPPSCARVAPPRRLMRNNRTGSSIGFRRFRDESGNDAFLPESVEINYG